MAISEIGIPTEAVAEPEKRSFFVDLLIRLVKEKPLGVAGGIIVLILWFTGTFANFLAPYPMDQINLAHALQPSSAQFLLGTDELGRDILSRIIFGARISMIVGLCAAILDVLVATTLGVLSGFIGGKVDLVIQRFVDSWMCFPPLFLILSLVAVLGQGIVQVIIVIGLLFGVSHSRVVRSAVISVKENMYVSAAMAVGCSAPRIVFKHILPHITAPILVLFTVDMAAAIITEATISFLGWGIPPPNPSWGGMLSGGGRRFMLMAPWLALWPGLALSIVVYGTNMLGDAIRDLIDPRLRGGAGRYGTLKTKARRRVTAER